MQYLFKHIIDLLYDSFNDMPHVEYTTHSNSDGSIHKMIFLLNQWKWKKSWFKLVGMQMTKTCIINREIVVQQWEIFNRNIQYIIKQKVGVPMNNIYFKFL